MAVSGTYDFNLDIDEVIQEATEMIGGEDTLESRTCASARPICKFNVAGLAKPWYTIMDYKCIFSYCNCKYYFL